MTDPKKPDLPGGDMWIHSPLPYVVRVRETLGGDPDTVPLEHDVRLTAYSVLEAMVQSTMALGASGIDDSRYKVIGVEPDVPAFMARLAALMEKR